MARKRDIDQSASATIRQNRVITVASVRTSNR